mgnify:CR=1 FL=1
MSRRSVLARDDYTCQYCGSKFQKTRATRKYCTNRCKTNACLDRKPCRIRAAEVQEQIARLDMAVDSALPGYKIRTLALPLGEWPKDKTIAHKGSWTDPKSGRKIDYNYDAVLLVAGGPARSPHDPEYNPLRYTREIITGTALTRMLDRLDREKTRYISDGNPQVVAKPAETVKPAEPVKPTQ